MTEFSAEIDNDVAAATAGPGEGWAELRLRARWEALLLSLAAVVVMLIAVLGVSISASRSVRHNFQLHLEDLAREAAQLVDPAAQAGLRDPSELNGARYRAAVAPLQRFDAALAEVHYVYTVALDGQQVRFVLDAARPGVLNADGLPEQSGLWEPYGGSDPAMRRALGLDGGPPRAGATEEPYADAWGTFMTGWAPIHDARQRLIGAIGVDVDARVFLQRLADVRLWAMLGMLPAMLLIAAFGYGFYRVRVNAHSAAIETRQAAQIAEWSARRLGEERERLSSLLDATHVGTWSVDLASATVSWDERCAALLGDAPVPVAHLPMPGWAARLHEDDRARLAAALEEARANPGAPMVCEFRARHAGGGWIWLMARGRVLEHDAAGQGLRLGGIQMDITTRKAMESELERAAHRDKLTGLANRAWFMERLQQAVARVRAGRQEHIALLYLDFDRFKLVNDTLGHGAGDELLRQIARRLVKALRAGASRGGEDMANIIGRFGGDEFVVLINDLADRQAAARIAERLLNALSPVYELEGTEVYSTASIGIALATGGRESAEELLRNADLAMYEAKRAGRACSVEFNEEMHTRLMRHVSIETSLRRAIGTQELSLVYQPIVALDTGRMTSAEALVRWHHPVMGPVPPSEFIPIAEDSGLVVALGQWVLDEACAQLAAWRASDPQRAPEYVSVNLSRAELALGNRLLERIRATLARHALPPACLQLEVTEREVMRNPAEALSLMKRLQQLGVRLAMDDFGTGTSSLAFLRDYPFNTIKVDRTFVKDVEASTDVLAVIHATITLVENLGMASVAEGVETGGQVAVLQSLGCRYAQGYWFSRPVAPGLLLGALDGSTVPALKALPGAVQDA